VNIVSIVWNNSNSRIGFELTTTITNDKQHETSN